MKKNKRKSFYETPCICCVNVTKCHQHVSQVAEAYGDDERVLLSRIRRLEENGLTLVRRCWRLCHRPATKLGSGIIYLPPALILAYDQRVPALQRISTSHARYVGTYVQSGQSSGSRKQLADWHTSFYTTELSTISRNISVCRRNNC